MDEKYCKFCGEKIPGDAVVCVKCGRQVEELKNNNPQVTINNNNNNNNNNSNQNPVNLKNKWVAFIFCFFFGIIGVHKFYEGKVGMGILYIFTGGLFGIGVLVDLIIILTRPEKYNPRA